MSNIKIEFNTKKENAFYGMKACLDLFQKTGSIVTESLLTQAYNEVKDNKEKRELFFSLLFSIGDITARQHNIFKGKKTDSGGNSNRESFYIVLNWMIKNHYEQFAKFLHAGLFNEYTCFDHLFRSRVQTQKTKVIKTYDMFANGRYCEDLVTYCYKIINGTNPFDKMLVAKFLTLPRLTKRSGHKRMLDETKQIMTHKVEFLVRLSELMNWEYQVSKSYANFIGYREWRKEYNQDLESVLFSSGKIKEFDKEQFLTWFDKLPAQARFRVKNRILYSQKENAEKWYPFNVWYKEWETKKLTAQAEQRKLEEKTRQGLATLEDIEKLKEVKKAAKVTVGATNFKELYDDICRGRIDQLKLESFMNRVNLPYNSLVIIDDSGSMRGAPYEFAMFMASVCMVKNPDDTARNLLAHFSNDTRLFAYRNSAAGAPNSLMRSSVVKHKPLPFVDGEKSFYENYKNISAFSRSVFSSGGTNLSSVPEGFKHAIDQDPEILDALKNYPIWTVISDGDINNCITSEASMNDFFKKCENMLGFKPFLVCINIGGYNSPNANRFAGIDNMMVINSNPSQIEQFLTNFKDMDTFDVYTPLLSLFRSNRYELVRNFTL